MSKRALRKLVIFSFFAAIFCGALSAQEVKPPRNNVDAARAEALKGELKKVSPVDGISEGEASTLVRVYSELYIGCGSLSGVTDHGDRWLVHGRVGLGAEDVKDFTIMKNTGAINYPKGPSFRDFSKLME